MCKHHEKLCPRPAVPHWRLVSEASPLILRVYLQNNSPRTRSGVSGSAWGCSSTDICVGQGPSSSHCQLQPWRFTELGKRSSALSWRSLLTNGALQFGDILGDFCASGKEMGWSPMAGWGSGGFVQRQRGEKGKRTEHCPTQCFVSSRIKLSGNMTCFYRSYSNCMHVLKTRKVMKKYLIIGTRVSQLVCMGFTIPQTRRTWIRFSLSFKVAFFKTDICAQFSKTICFIENTLPAVSRKWLKYDNPKIRQVYEEIVETLIRFIFSKKHFEKSRRIHLYL